MTKKYLLLLNSLEAQFSIIDTFSSFVLDYNDQNINYDQLDIEKDDMILGYFSDPRDEVTILFRVDSYRSNHLRVKKVLETEKGASITQNLKKEVLEKGLINLTDDEYKKILHNIKNNILIGDISSYDRDSSGAPSDQVGLNKVYYGTPGCGKSYKVMEERFDFVGGKWIDKPGKKSERTTFYPDYTNSDFVGQVMPGLDDNGQPTYEFVEGPFTKALIAAFNNPDKDVALIIEELNRGNAAAIFGEIFQLLDRDEIGKSQYNIYNPNIIKELNKEVHADKKPDGKDFINVYIPSNLSIIATMNTSDQNVYPLDTAFQRRWKFEKIKNSFLKDGVEETPESLLDQKNYVSEQAYELATMFIPGTATTWREFVKVLNEKIVESHDASFSSEDKQIGVYFLSKEELCAEKFTNVNDAAKFFSEKMLKYIWEDIAKLNPDDWFDGCKSLDEVFNSFSVNHLNVFKNMTFETYSEEEQ